MPIRVPASAATSKAMSDSRAAGLPDRPVLEQWASFRRRRLPRLDAADKRAHRTNRERTQTVLDFILCRKSRASSALQIAELVVDPQFYAKRLIMAKQKASKSKSAGNGHALVIVESPAKARTIGKFLGKRLHGRGQHRPRPRSAAGRQADSGRVQGRAVGEPGRRTSTTTSRRSTSSRPARASRSSCSRTSSRRPTPSIWRRTKTAKERPSVGTCSRC